MGTTDIQNDVSLAEGSVGLWTIQRLLVQDLKSLLMLNGNDGDGVK
jgi:hypothetical protein